MNNLQINLTKTNYINFNNQTIPLQIKYKNSNIDELNETKFLGLVINRQLNWDSHIKGITARINKFAYALKCLRNLADKPTLLTTYHAYVASTLRYGLLIWGNGTDVERVLLAQKKCLRAMTRKSPLDSCKPLFEDLGLLPLPCLYIYEACIFVKQHLHLFVKAIDVNPRCRRNPHKLVFF